MAAARDELAVMDDFTLATIMLARFEARLGDGEDMFLWAAQGWVGGDFDKLWLKSDGEGAFGGGVESAAVQGLWSHAAGPRVALPAGRSDERRDGKERASTCTP